MSSYSNGRTSSAGSLVTRGWPEGRKPSVIRLTPSQGVHITVGDNRGGGHLHGVQPKPGTKKRWFPDGWTTERILEIVERIARDPLVVVALREGAFNCYGEVDRVRIKVRVNPDGAIVTGHPIDGDGVAQIDVKVDGSVVLKVVPYGSSGEVSW